MLKIQGEYYVFIEREREKFFLEWAYEHRDELLKNWELAQDGKLPNKIEPLV